MLRVNIQRGYLNMSKTLSFGFLALSSVSQDAAFLKRSRLCSVCVCVLSTVFWRGCSLMASPQKCCDLGTCVVKLRGRQTGGFQTGGFPDLDLSFLFCPFLSFLGLSRFFWDFPDLLGDGPGIFPICPFPPSRRHNLDLSRKKWETPGFGNPPV